MHFERIKLSYMDADDYIQQCMYLNNSSEAGIFVANMTRAIAKLWVSENRPYYRLYPGVLDFLIDWDHKKLWKLDLSCLPMGLQTLEIEIPEEYWSKVGFRSAVLHPLKDEEQNIAVLISSSSLLGGGVSLNIWNHAILQDGPSEVTENTIPMSSEQLYILRKVISGVIAVGDNPDIVKAVPLSKDRDKYEKTLDQKYIEKARRRGIFGFDVGKDVPTREELNTMIRENEEAIAQGRKIPHIRGACLATYWTGKGGCIPKIILRKSCLVNKDLLTKVPQGYYGKEDLEVKEKQNANRD